ncbi:MAG: endolytic transglycosylase MltG [Pseudomonadota bacterium]
MGVRKFFRRLVLTVFLLCLIAAGFLGWSFYAAIYKWTSPIKAIVEIEPGSSVQTIALKLAANKVLNTPKIFTAYVRLAGKSGKLKAGEYEFPAGLTAHEVLQKILKGDVIHYELQIIEGWSVADIADYLAKQPIITDPQFAADFKRLAKSKEGYMFPDTYRILRPKSAQDLIDRFEARFNEVYSPEIAAVAKDQGLSKQEVITLASIVEKETGLADERPVIASVFLNRLKNNIALQSDPTVIYGLSNFDGNLRKQDLANPHPYNTYVHAGLPPGPICNPGQASIEAVLYPAQTHYLYFVSKNDGSHEFSRTLEEHNRAVQKYQMRRNVSNNPPKSLPAPKIIPQR